MPREKMIYEDLFPPMVQVVMPVKVGSAEVTHFDVSERESRMTMLSHRPYLSYVPPGRYARLTIGGMVVMSDTEMERKTNASAVRHAVGDVLVGGLGLGMVLIGMARKPEVRTVTVVETSQDVMQAVWPQVSRFLGRKARKVTIVHADVREFKTATKFDAAYFDIWPDISTENLPEMARLAQRFKGRLRRDGERKPWMGSWMQDYLRDERRSDRGRW